MTAPRHRLATLGGIAFCLGLLAVAVPGITRILPVSGAVERLGNDYLLVALLSVGAIVPGLWITARWAVRGFDQATPPEPERAATGPRPGEGIDRIIDGSMLRTWLFVAEYERVRERLRDTAVRTLVRTSDCASETARERVRRGTWTEDREAAAFLGGDSAPTVSWRTKVAATLGGEWWFKRASRRVAAEIVDIGDPDGTDD